MSDVAKRLDRIEKKLDRLLATEPSLPGRRPKVAYDDPEVWQELLRLFAGPCSIMQAHAELVTKFGKGRAPSKSAIGRARRRIERERQ